MGAGRNELEKNCTPAQVNITLCNIPLSLEELLTYFPFSLKFHEVAFRLHTHGCSHTDIRNYIYWSRQLKHRLAVSRDSILKWSKRAKEYYKENPGLSNENSLSAIPSRTDRRDHSMPGKQRKRTPLAHIHDYRLIDLARGVKHHPEGEGRQGLTHAIELAQINGHDTVMLSGVREYILKHSLFVIDAPYDCATEDKATMERVHAKAKAYYEANVVVASQGNADINDPINDPNNDGDDDKD